MIRELINFTASLDESFKNLGSLPKEGLHIRFAIKTQDQQLSLDLDNYQYEQYSKKQKDPPSDFLNQCKLLHQNAWCLDTNKCLDLPVKAIHTCSPFAVAFKKEHLQGGSKFIENQGKKKQIYERFNGYFEKAFALFSDQVEAEKYEVYKRFFTENTFSNILAQIAQEDQNCRKQLEIDLASARDELKLTTEKDRKERIKEKIAEIEQRLLKVKPLEDSSYILFYLHLPLEAYQVVHKKYLDDKLFNTADYNTLPDSEGRIFGTSNFMNGFNSNMPFLMHQTATFDISGRISNTDARLLNDLKNIFSNKTLPSPLPIFIDKEELQRRVISIFKESGNPLNYKEIIPKLFEDNEPDLANYYLLFWRNTKEGVEFNDFDFVSQFEYRLPEPVVIQNLFEFREFGEKENKHYPLITNIFDLESQVFKPLIQNKYHELNYFEDLRRDNYAGLDLTFLTYCKYRKAVYDFVYKSRKKTIDSFIFKEMAFNSILDDLKNAREYGIKEKLNIWYSLYKFFTPKYDINMADKLKEYQDFVTALTAEEPVTDVTDEKFAFAAGQVIRYIQDKSESNDNSYNLLEPYLQQSRCSEFKKAIANDFGRYRHKLSSRNFEKVAAFVLSYETDVNLKNYLPQVLSGVFAKNQLKGPKNPI